MTATIDWNGFKQRRLRLAWLELRIVELPQRETFRSAIGQRHSRRALIVRWHDRDGAWGIGECSCRPDAFFSHEFLDGAWLMLKDQIRPRLAQIATYGELLTLCDRIRGWPFTKAALLEAVHDLWRRQGLDDPLDAWQALRVDRVPIGISLGLFDSAKAAITRMEHELTKGYRRIKLKIDPGVDRGYFAAIRQAFPNLHLGFDANGSFDAGHLDDLARSLDLPDITIEQPFTPDRLDLHAKLKRRLPNATICLDESITSLGNLIAARQLDAMGQINIKPGRVGGQVETIGIAEYAAKHELTRWVGGMFESGIGRAANLRVAARLPEATAHDLSPSSRYFPEDIVESPLEMNADGTISAPEQPVRVHEPNLEKRTVRLDKGNRAC